MSTLPGQNGQAEVYPAEPVQTARDANGYEGPGIEPLGDPCPRFQLDYVTSGPLAHRPEHRYCRCGWTEAHHLLDEPEPEEGVGIEDTQTGQGVL
jgi:hypothetical protein